MTDLGMRSLLLRNNKLNWSFIAPVIVSFLSLSILSLLALPQQLDQVSEDKKWYLISTSAINVLFVFNPILWALALRWAPDGDKIKSVIYPTILMGFLNVVIHSAQYFWKPVDLKTNTEDPVLSLSVLFISVLAGVLFRELLFDTFRNKLLLYIVGGFASSAIITSYLIYFTDSGWVSTLWMSSTEIESAFITYAFIKCIMHWRGIKFPIEQTEKQQNRNTLRAHIRKIMETTSEPQEIITAAQQAFPETPFKLIVKEFRKSPHPGLAKEYSAINHLLAILLVGSAFYSLIHAPALSLYSSWNWLETIGKLLLQVVLPASIIIKIHLAGDLFAHKPYAYKAVALFGIVSCCVSLYNLMAGQGDLWTIANMSTNIIMICMAFNLVNVVYPYYHSIFKRPNEFNEYDVRVTGNQTPSREFSVSSPDTL